MDDTLFPHVGQPITIGGCEIRNRIVRAAHGTLFGVGEVSERLIAYHEARGRGGVGLSVVEIMSVHPSSMGALPGFLDTISPGLERLADRCHTHGMRVFQQLWHGGANAHPFDGGPAWAPSALPDPMEGRLPLAMTQAMIDEIVGSFAATARRCRDAGLDGVEVHAAHGYLVGSFLSPATNHRDDDYGGSLQGRSRFLEQILAAIRAETGPGFAVGFRISGSEAVPTGLEPDESARIVQRVVGTGLTDYVSVSMGSYYAMPKFIGGMHEPAGYEVPTSGPVLDAAGDTPTIVVGRIHTLEHAERVIADGVADMVAMVRPTIADPDLVVKSLAGRADEVRPCISCNQGCVGGLFGPAQVMGCTVNPDVGHEHETARPSPGPRKIAVVGGGPAGLEAAVTAASRGHQVVMYEATGQLGGQIRWARRAPHRNDLGLITDWLATRLDRLGVKVLLDTPATVEALSGRDVDAVIVATGARSNHDRPLRFRPGSAVPGLDLPHVLAPEVVLAPDAPQARRAVVFDDLGTAAAPSIAEHLLETGADVVLATSLVTYGAELGPSFQRDPYHTRLGAHPKFRALTEVTVSRVEPGTVTLTGLHDGQVHQLAADLVVPVVRGRPVTDLYEQVTASGAECHLVGDAVEPLDLQHAIATARRVATAI
jgi:2,4-dienoyl-CoA reductase-like NADH-dependent reductase (Old Yellow Enzyme family)/threonine dehydrogenase-like Zn-dependent dehydrogenase